MPSSRRTFLTYLSATAGLGLLPQVPARGLWALTPDELMPEPEEAILRELALVAVEAARAAGATFADIRIGAGRSLNVSSAFSRSGGRVSTSMATPKVRLRMGYGIRAVVDGAWGFAAGQDFTSDGVARIARSAVTRARANRPRRPRTLALAAAPRVTDGRWTMPIAEDPFAVPVGVQGDRQLEALATMAALPAARMVLMGFTWHRALRLFASSEGTLLVQRTAFANPGGLVDARAGEGFRHGREGIEELKSGPYGYEAVSRVDLPNALRRAVERAVEESRQRQARSTSVDVGRYDLVVGASAMVDLLTTTLADALNAERALGYQANQAGTSFAAPPSEMLGAYEIGAPLLTLRADRTRPQGAATLRWDDEGVPTTAFPLIEAGVVVDYLTDRQCAPELAAWYEARGTPVRSRGCASGMGEQRPSVRLPNLALAPGVDAATVDDLIRDTKRGFYVRGLHGGTDQQVLSGQFRAGAVRAIRNGQLAESIGDMAIQFATPALWRSLDALGGPAAVETGHPRTGLASTDPLQLSTASVSAVPGRFRQVNVLNTGRTA